MATQADASASTDIDDSLYSRQRYVLGDEAMRRMASSTVFVSGVNAVGVEIAKNVALAGVKQLTLHSDPHCSPQRDARGNFFLSTLAASKEGDAGQTCAAEACLAHIRDLNPYTSVDTLSFSFHDGPEAWKRHLENYSVIVLVDASQDIAVAVDDYCRACTPAKGFISCSLAGLASELFVDLGPTFHVSEASSEPLVDSHIASITKGASTIVECLPNSPHGLEEGDSVSFSEVQGIDALNGRECRVVRVLDAHRVDIGDLSDLDGHHTSGGLMHQRPRARTLHFQSLSQQLAHPQSMTVDFSQPDHAMLSHVAFRALDAFRSEANRDPEPDSADDLRTFLDLAEPIAMSIGLELNLSDQSAASAAEAESEDCQPLSASVYLRRFCRTCSGVFPPLAAVIGGWASQEALKAISGKFHPIQQWLAVDALRIARNSETDRYVAHNDGFDHLRVCIGQAVLSQLQQARVFMVGCGAIGCEMLKNLALLDACTSDQACLTITDHDLIEKSNLNRQFLFRSHHVQQPKSKVAAESTRSINPRVRIDAHQRKVDRGTCKTHYTDEFFQQQSLCINALDNVAARLLMDDQCVSNQRPLVESGTLGTKGNVQAIVPHLTENYGATRDPQEKEVPYCTLKSFPYNVDHCVQWARDKFASLFEIKPADYNAFWEDALDAVQQDSLERLSSSSKERLPQVLKLQRSRCSTWQECVASARLKFEKYFRHKALQLLSSFPPDHVDSEGKPFWSPPRRQPRPQEFDISNPLHRSFVVSMALLFASRDKVDVPSAFRRASDVAPSTDDLAPLLDQVQVPEFQAKNDKVIVTDEKASGPAKSAAPSVVTFDDATALKELHNSAQDAKTRPEMAVAEFEKDDDSNSHVDLIAAAANLRAAMYGIKQADRLECKRIAGKIVPAIATSTAAVAGLAAIEMVKLFMKPRRLALFSNSFLNMATPVMIFSEPMAPAVEEVSGRAVTVWDQWNIQGSKSMTLGDFIDRVQSKYGCEATGVFYGSTALYLSFDVAGAAKKRSKKMAKLLKKVMADSDATSVYLFVTYDKDGEEQASPLIKYTLLDGDAAT